MNIRYLVASVLLLPASVMAAPLTFDAALERAAADAPSLRGSAAGVEAAQSAAIAADRLPDPTLDIGIRDFPVTGPDAGSLNRDNFTMTTIGVSQQFVNPAKRLARAERASAEIGIAQADVQVEARSVRLQTALAWVDLYYAGRRLEQLKLLDESLGDLQSTVNSRLASGSARPSQALEPDQLRAQVNDRPTVLITEMAKARAALARFTGDPDPQVAGAPPALTVNPARLKATGSRCGSRSSCTSSGSWWAVSNGCTSWAECSATKASARSTTPSSRCSRSTRPTVTTAR